MKTREKIRHVLFILIGMLLFGSIGSVSANESIIDGGDSFENAVLLEPGSYNGELSIEDLEYYSITNITPGQKLTIKVDIPEAGLDYPRRNPEIILYDQEKSKLKSEFKGVGGNEFGSLTVYWTSNSNEPSYSFYLKILEKYLASTEGPYSYIVDISIDDCFDADSQTDAGNTFDTALNTTPGEYTSYFEMESGDDKVDIYMLSLESGDKLDVTVTPSGDAQFEINIYDQDRIKMSGEYSANKGAIVKISETSPSAQDVYIEIKKRLGTSSDKEYSLNIAVENGVETEQTESPTEDTSAEETQTEEIETEETEAGETEAGETQTEGTQTEDTSNGGSSIPGFGLLITVTGILTVGYLLLRR